ncbi:hypothetical protein A500_04541 [Clostridium sartagoforme AAU1]|uniref:Uncharacterized protein n=1 Tax=Clostridium sartagoforme AAU1 TaxID=1202534 RepID=R9CJQ3_9CLOT|nr:hypothetical protein [Clostridium sartagoforme]EOR27381.1 hypothetical protein A500_04541 [Clostridium sartagoforme AAU1]
MISDNEFILGLVKAINEDISNEGEKFLYKITMKSCNEEKLYYSYNENLITDVLDAVELEYKFIPFGKELLINVDEIIAIEKVGE